MPTPSGSDSDRVYRVLTIVSAALLASVVLYAGLGVFLVTSRSGIEPLAPELPTAALYGLLVAAAILLLVPVLIERRDGERARGREPSREELQRLQSATIVALALREGAAIIGLAATLLSGQIGWVLGLAGLSALAMLAGWPRRG